MTEPAGADWPYLWIELTAPIPDEASGQLSQASVDAGALGATVEAGRFTIYLPQAISPVAIEAIRQALERETAALGWKPTAWRAASLPDAPWATAWADGFKTFPIGHRLLVRPCWEHGEPPPAEWADRLAIWLEPGQGFGTGHHETTQLTLEALERLVRPGDRVLDFGSGSGVLSIAAARLGADGILAVEHDPQANGNARHNFALNEVSGRIDLRETDRIAPDWGAFRLIVCNMLPQHALGHLAGLSARLDGMQARLIYSGYLADEYDEVQRALRSAGLRPLDRRAKGEWGVLTATR